MFGKRFFLIFSIVLFLPIVTADLQPVFLDQDVHYLEEEINLGLVGLIPDNLNQVNIKIVLRTGTIFLDIDRELEYISDYPFVFPNDFIDSQPNVVYTYYNNNNQVIDAQTHQLKLVKIQELDNLQYCISGICELNDYELTEDEDVILQINNSPDYFSYNIKTINNWYVINEINTTNASIPLELFPGDFEIRITPEYNGHIFKRKSLYLTILPNEIEKLTWREYFDNQDLYDDAQFEETTPIVKTHYSDTTTKESIEDNQETVFNYWWIMAIIAIIILLFILFKKPKEKDKEEISNRRTRRKERGFVFFVLFLVLLSPTVLANQNKFKEFENTEIKYTDFKQLYPYPEELSVSISESQNNNTTYYPITAEGLSEFMNLDMVFINKTPNLSATLETILLARDITTLPENTAMPITGCEQILFWFDRNPITNNIKTISDRTKENLINNITIDASETANLNKKDTETCIKDLIDKGYLFEKKILLKISYTEKDTSNFSEKEDKQDEIIFKHKGKDILETAFMGSDLNHIKVNINYVSEMLKEDGVTISGIPSNRITKSGVMHNNEIVSSYQVPFLNEGEELIIKYDVQLVNLEIIESDYGKFKKITTNEYANKGRNFVIEKADLWALKKKIIQNHQLSGKVVLENGEYKFGWDEESTLLLAEVNYNPLKYLIINKKQMIIVGDNLSQIVLGIDKKYGVIYENNSLDKIFFLEQNKVINKPKAQKNQYLEILQDIFVKESSEKNLEFVRHILPIIYVFEYSKNLNIVLKKDGKKNINEVFFKTYDAMADLINKGDFEAIEKNIIFNNLISLTEDFCFVFTDDQHPKCFNYRARYALNYGLVKYIDNPDELQNFNPDNASTIIPRLYYNDYLLRKGFVDNTLNELMVWGLIGDRFGSHVHREGVNVAATIDTDGGERWKKQHEKKVKDTIRKVLTERKVDETNIGYYKDLLTYPFYRLGTEQKECWYDLNDQQIVTAISANKDYCYKAYNIRPGNLGTAFSELQVTDFGNTNYNPYEVLTHDLQNQLYSAYRTQIVFDDAYLQNNKIEFNHNKISLKKINAMISLIEGLSVYASPNGMDAKQGEAVLLSYKLVELWNSKDNKIKELDTDKEIANAITNINNQVVYNATAKLREAIKQDRALRLYTYKLMSQTDWDKYVEGVRTPGEYNFDRAIGDFALFFITGGWFESGLTKLGTLDGREIKNIEKVDRERYNRLLNGACCIAQRLGELEENSQYKNWTATQIKLMYGPRRFVFDTDGKIIKDKPKGLVKEYDFLTNAGCSGVQKYICAEDIKYLYNDPDYGQDISIILNDYDPRPYDKEQYVNKYYITDDLTGYYYSNRIKLILDTGYYIHNTDRELKEIEVYYKPSAITTILRTIDESITPLTIILTIATAGVGQGMATGTGGFFTKIAHGFTAPLKAPTLDHRFASNLLQRLVYEFGENVAIDGAFGMMVYAKPEVVRENPILITLALGVIAGKVQGGGKAAIKSLDNVASEIADDIIDSAKIKSLKNLDVDDLAKLKKEIKEVISEELIKGADNRADLLRKIKNGELADAFVIKYDMYSITDTSLFKKISKLADGDFSIDAKKIKQKLKKLNVSISKNEVDKLLNDNFAYTMLKKQQADDFLAIKNKIIRNRKQIQYSYQYLVTTQNYRVVEGFSENYTDIIDVAKNSEALYYIDPDHFPRVTRFKYGKFGEIEGFYRMKNPGLTLAEHVYYNGASSELLDQIDDAIAKAHKHGYPHGNLSLDNIFVTKVGDSYKITIGSPAGYDFMSDPNLINVAKKYDLECIADLKDQIKKGNLGMDIVNEDHRPLLRETTQIGETIAVYDNKGKVVIGKVDNIKDNTLTLDTGKKSIFGKKLVDYPKNTQVSRLNVGTIINVDGEVGEIVDLTTNGKIVSKLSNGDLKLYDADVVLKSQNVQTFIDQTNPRVFNLFNIGEVYSYGSFQKYPDQFVSYNYSFSLRHGSGEILFVNKNDPIIQEFLKNIREITDGIDDPLLKLQKTYDYVSYTFNSSKGIKDLLQEQVRLDGVLINDDFVSLSYFITTRTGVCRHNAMAIKIACDEIGIPSELVAGDLMLGTGGGYHAWVIAKINGEDWLIDPAQRKFAPFSELSLKDRSYIEQAFMGPKFTEIREIPKTMDTTPKVLKEKLNTFTELLKQRNYNLGGLGFTKTSQEINEVLTKVELVSLSKEYFQDMSLIYNKNRAFLRQLDNLDTALKNKKNIDAQLKELKGLLKTQYDWDLAIEKSDQFIIDSSKGIIKYKPSGIYLDGPLILYADKKIIVCDLQFDMEGEKILDKIKDTIFSKEILPEINKNYHYSLAPINGEYKIISNAEYMENFEEISNILNSN